MKLVPWPAGTATAAERRPKRGVNDFEVPPDVASREIKAREPANRSWIYFAE